MLAQLAAVQLWLAARTSPPAAGGLAAPGDLRLCRRHVLSDGTAAGTPASTHLLSLEHVADLAQKILDSTPERLIAGMSKVRRPLAALKTEGYAARAHRLGSVDRLFPIWVFVGFDSTS